MARYIVTSRGPVFQSPRAARQFQPPVRPGQGLLEIFLPTFVDIMPQGFLLCHSLSPLAPQLGFHYILGALRWKLEDIFLLVRCPSGFPSVPGPNQSKNEGRVGNLTENCNWSHLTSKTADVVSGFDKENIIYIRWKGGRHDWSGTPSVPWELFHSIINLESETKKTIAAPWVCSLLTFPIAGPLCCC